jgi:arylformamidase
VAKLERQIVKENQHSISTTVATLAALIGDCDAVDLAPMLSTNMARWSTHPDFAVIPNARNFEQNGYFLQTLIMPEHVGCHVDVPAHFHRSMPELTMDAFAPDCVMGPARKLDVSGLDLAPGVLLTFEQFETALEAADLSIGAGDVVIFEFGWDKNLPGGAAGRGSDWWGKNNPGLSAEVCAYLAERHVKAVGADTASVDLGQRDGETTADHGHRTYFLPNLILIVEGLRNLAAVPEVFYFLALPLNIEHGSGSPLRPIALVPRA